MTAPATTTPRPNSQVHRVLVVEDEEALAFGVKDALEHAGFQCQVVHDGPTALDRIRTDQPDLVVLDLMLPGMGGLEILGTLRKERRDVRVVILTALASESDLIQGFELGADDYMKKPFSPRELVARVEAQFRRREMDTAPPPRLELPNGISVDLARLEVHREGQVIQLTPREGDILDYLIRNRHRVVTRDDLLLDVWHYKSANVETRTVDIHIVGLRRKVEPNPAEPTLIQTVRGKGYRWFSSAPGEHEGALVQLTLGTKRTALALYGVLLVLPTIVLGGLHWRQLVMDHEAMLASVPGDARDVTNQIRIAIRDSLRAVVDREELRGFYEYKPNYFPPGTLGTDLAFVPSPLRVGPTRPEILGWFSYSHDDIGRGRPPIGLIGSRESEPDAQDRLDQTLIWTLDLQRRDRARRERVKSIEESIEDVVNIFTLPAKERELLALVPSRVDKLRLPILAINLSEEESIDCIREELPALRVYELEEQQVSISQFRLRFYRDDLGSPRVVAMRSVSIPGNEHLANFKGCFESLGKRTIIEQGFFIDAEWLFHELPASTAAKFIQKGSPHRFIPMEEAKLPNRAGVEDYEVLPIQWLDLEMMDESDIEYGMFKVAVNVDDLERRFHTVGVRFLGVAAMLIVSLATGLVLLLRSVNRDLETARRTENFIAAVTHELRTPVAAIKLYGEMLQDGWVDDDPNKLKEYYRRIVRETGRLETLVENVLEKSQIARREADPEPGDLNAVVESLEGSLKSLGPDGVEDLEFEYGEDLPQVMLIPEGVRSIVSNLVENARKYAPVKPGVAGAEPIVVRTHVLADMAVLDVMDRGPGIPHAERTKIFQAFYRVGNETTRTARGTGLGLHLVLLQSNAMGARISVLDRKGGGTVFRVTFQPGAPA